MGRYGQEEFGAELGGIATEWDVVFDKVQFVQRYARAIHGYLLALIKKRDAAEEVAQNFLLWVTEHGFPRAKQERGRFRNYLKAALRNAALNFLQRQRPTKQFSCDLSQVPAPAACERDQIWLAQWRACLLKRAWQELRKRQDRCPNDLCYTVLRATVANPDADSSLHASLVSRTVGRAIRPDAFRKQLSRARQLFARILVREVAQSLDKPTPETVAEELGDLGLMKYVRSFLPPGWHGWKTLPF